MTKSHFRAKNKLFKPTAALNSGSYVHEPGIFKSKLATEALNIEVFDSQGIFLNKLSAGLNIISHQSGEHLIR